MLEDILKEYGAKEVEAMEVYRDIYSLGDGLIQRSGEQNTLKANPIGYYRNNGQKKGHYRVLLDDTFEETLKELQEADFAIINGITYFGRKNVQEHASKMYAMIFDLDGVTDETLNAFLSGAYADDYDIYPIPNYIALSGHGVHLYYIFEEPVPLYPNLKIQLKSLKYALTDKMWNRYTSKSEKKQYQGINQGFRPIGGKTKIDGVKVRAFQLNLHPFSLAELGKYIPEEYQVDESKLYRESKMTLAEAKKAYPQWYQDKIINKQERRYWIVKDDLYEWWLRQIRQKASLGHRYFDVMCLAIYAAKCNIPYEDLEIDALELIPFMNLIAPDQEFTEADVYSALECYDVKYCTFPIEDIEKLSGIQIKRNRRNGRKQALHLQIARNTRDILHPDGWQNKEGRPKKAEAVKEWRKENPNGKMIDCHRATGMSRDTIRKWWNET
jgi:hypothetical protein